MAKMSLMEIGPISFRATAPSGVILWLAGASASKLPRQRDLAGLERGFTLQGPSEGRPRKQGKVTMDRSDPEYEQWAKARRTFVADRSKIDATLSAENT